MDTNKAWQEEIERIMQLDLDDMDYDDMVKLTLEYQDEEELERWEEAGSKERCRKQEEFESKYGVSYPIRKDAPEKVKQVYEKLCEIELAAAREGIIIN